MLATALPRSTATLGVWQFLDWHSSGWKRGFQRASEGKGGREGHCGHGWMRPHLLGGAI